MVVPEGHDEDVAVGERCTHAGVSAELAEVRAVAEDRLLFSAELVGDGVAVDALVLGVGVGEDGAVLDVEALDVGKVAAGADELGDDGHLLGGVQGLAGAVELTVTHAVRLD